MIRQIAQAVGITFSALILTCCNNNTTSETVKFGVNDPFKSTIVPDQLFQIDSRQDNVIEGGSGTIIVFPKGCFRNANGAIVEENVKIELAEALTLQDMLLSNLTTTADGKLLETDGMIYFNATANGKPLTVNKDIPVHIEIPTHEKKPGMKAYRGTRDENGNMNWADPKELDNYLAIIDIDMLDFLPDGFRVGVETGLPFRNHQVATNQLSDSLYYSLSHRTNYSEGDTAVSIACGIDPAIIKTIHTKKYQNTFIATHEFEKRLKEIFLTCDNDIIEIYINNLEKNLYEVDSLAAARCEEKKYNHFYHVFDHFYQQRLTRVRQADKYAALLKGYYEKQLAKIKSELLKEKDKLVEELKKKDSKNQAVVDEYKKLLWKREKYSMETYGFEWTETGWVNIDNGTLPKDWYSRPLEILVENGKQFDRVYTYVVYTSIKSLYRLNTTDNEQFYAGSDNDRQMIMPRQRQGVAIAIGYKNEVPSLAIREFETGSESAFTLKLSPSTLDKVRDAVKSYEEYAPENQILTDLEYMKIFYEQEQQQIQERKFILRLMQIAFPCCGEGM
jgi:hypothetical protein